MSRIGRGIIARMLGLDKSVVVSRVKEPVAGGRWLVELDVKRPKRCVHCGSANPWFHGRGRLRQVRHSRAPDGRWLVLRFRADRYRCSMCKRTFTALPACCRRWSRVSMAALSEMLEQLRYCSFSRVSGEYGVHVRTLCRYFDEVVLLEVDWERFRDGRPVRIVVDEHSFAGRRMVLTVVERERSLPIAILPDDRKVTLVKFLKTIPKDIVARVDATATDMCARFRSALREVVGVEPAADRFHVVRDAQRRVDRIRLVEQTIMSEVKGEPVTIGRRLLCKAPENLSARGTQRLHEILAIHPRLALYYRYKERVRCLYKARNRRQATKLLEAIIGDLEQEWGDPELHQWARTLKNWRENILLYFDTQLTTAVVEGYHNVIKLHKRISFGFKNLDTYIKKIMLALVPYRFKPLHTY